MTELRIAIVGAGPAGLAAAFALRDSNCAVTVFEKSKGLCGRAAARTRHGVRLEPGANYIKIDSPEVENLIRQQLPTGELVEIENDIWTHDATGRFEPGDPDLNLEPKWTYRSGISTLGKLLAAESKAEIVRKSRITALEPDKSAWKLLDENGSKHGPFERVLLTPPGPQVVEILKASGLESEIWAGEIITSLSKAVYHRQFTFAFGFRGQLSRPGRFYASVNPDGRHPISWLSFENDKPGHIPAGWTVVGAQMRPAWSAERFEDDFDRNAATACEELVKLLGWESARPDWHDVQRWKFAHPFAAADAELARAGESAGIFIAGDALVGKGRVNRALETGLDAARRIRI